MKNFWIFLVVSLVSLGGFSQSSKVVSAYNYLKFGQLKEAKEAIDAASKHEKTLNQAKTWWYKGQVYHGISDSCMYGHPNTRQKFCEMDSDPAGNALEFYFKSLTLNFKDPKWHNLDILNNEADQKAFGALMGDQKSFDNTDLVRDLFMNRFPALANSLVNKGVSEYSSQNPETQKKAIKSFENSLFLSGMTGKVDTVIINYLALACFKAKDWDKAIESYEVLIKVVAEVNFNKVAIGMTKADVVKLLGKPLPANQGQQVSANQELIEYNDGTVVLENGKVKEVSRNSATYYFQLAQCYKNKGDTAKYSTTLFKGIEKYPDSNNELISDLINYYIETKRSKEALEYLDLAISKSPDNYTFYFAKGSLVDQMLTAVAEKPFIKIRVGMKAAEVIKLMGEPVKKSPVSAKPPIKSEKFEYPDGEVVLENGVVKSLKDKNVPSINEQIGDLENKAIGAYAKAIQIKPDYFDANYNLGALYFNKGVRYNEIANEISDNKLYEEEKKKADDQFKLSIPNLEKAYELQPTDQNTIVSLKTLYFRLRNESPEMMDKYKKIQAILDSQKN